MLFQFNNLLSKAGLIIQLTFVLLSLSYFEVEYNSGIGHITPFIAIGFILFLFLSEKPSKYVFLLVGLAVTYFAFGLAGGSVLIAITLGLIGICHLPIPGLLRWLIIFAVGAAFYLLRAELFYMPRIQMLVPFIASMFMFRIIIYMHDLKYSGLKASWLERVSYFLMFPNLCFLLFPIVDFKLFVNHHYTKFNAPLIQKGIKSLLRGLCHILVYRIIYHYIVLSPIDVAGPMDAFMYLVFSYTLILRLSGIFHLCLGFLQIFGYDLPKVFDNYFLASGPSDLWRRVNLYWREFMMKIFYYRVYIKIKSLGTIQALLITSLCVFLLTWFFHSYQWFWFQGTFLFSLNNTLFWLVLGIAVSTNAVIQYKKPLKKSRKNSNWNYSSALKLSVGTVLMFLSMSILWSLWSSPTMNDWLFLMQQFQGGSLSEYCGIIAVIMSALLLLVIRQYVNAKLTIKSWFSDENHRVNTTWSLAGVCVLGGLILFKYQAPPNIHNTIWLSEKLNKWDTAIEEEGYYEGILGKNAPVLWELQISRRDLSSDIMKIDRSILIRALKPNVSTTYKGGRFTTNSLGMRDIDYDLRRSNKKYRVLLVGGSYELGAGVNDGENYESRLEEMLNDKVEIFNLAVGGYNLPQVSHVVAHSKKYNGDALMTVFHTNEGARSVANLARLIKEGRHLPFDYLKVIKEKSGARQHMSKIEIRQRLEPFAEEIEKGFLRFVSGLCDKYGLQKIWVFLPATKVDVDNNYVDGIIKFATQLGYDCIDLRHVYEGLSAEDRIISKEDSHPNAPTHRKIAIALKKSLTPIIPY